MRVVEYIQAHTNPGILLYLMIAIANINYSGLLDYALQAITGGLIWFGFKVLGDWYDRRQAMKNKMASETTGANKQ
jgi:hypothetical protein